MSAVTVVSVVWGTLPGIAGLLSAVRVPRAFLKYSMVRPVTIPRTPTGSPVVMASPLVTSPRLASATA
jgi:hypothetical protein